jgi:hypothetical protein
MVPANRSLLGAIVAAGDGEYVVVLIRDGRVDGFTRPLRQWLHSLVEPRAVFRSRGSDDEIR